MVANNDHSGAEDEEEKGEKEEEQEPGSSTRRTVLKTLGAAGAGLAVSSDRLRGGEGGTADATPQNAALRDRTRGRVTGSMEAAEQSGHKITSCTTITAPGTYEVVADITSTGTGACIEIRADNVTLRGNGHELSGDGNGVGVATNSSPRVQPLPHPTRRNVVVENLHVTNFSTGIRYDWVSGGRIEDLTARSNGIGVLFFLFVTGVTVRNSTLADSGSGFVTQGHFNVWGGPSNNTLEHNAITANSDGILLGRSTGHHDFLRNRIVGNDGGAKHAPLDATAHRYRNNVICRNQNHGIRNEDQPAAGGIPAFEETVSATDNYWGASNGPSSIGTPPSPFTDPVTGTPADGDGDAISESLTAGVANVRFDPFLSSAPPNAGPK